MSYAPYYWQIGIQQQWKLHEHTRGKPLPALWHTASKTKTSLKAYILDKKANVVVSLPQLNPFIFTHFLYQIMSMYCKVSVMSL